MFSLMSTGAEATTPNTISQLSALKNNGNINTETNIILLSVVRPRRSTTITITISQTRRCEKFFRRMVALTSHYVLN